MRIQGSSVFRYVFLAVFISCGSNGMIPDVTDAALPDSMDDALVCECPSAEILRAEQMQRISRDMNLIRHGESGLGVTCDGMDLAIGGGCRHQPSYSGVQAIWAGFTPYPDSSDDIWHCSMRNPTFEDKTLVVQLNCLTPDDNIINRPDGCDCSPVEPVQDRIVRVTRAGTLAGYGSDIIGASCELGSMLIGGSCVTEPYMFRDGVSLSRAGVVPNAAATWICGWDNATDLTGWIEATAICIAPPSPGTAPDAVSLTERITYRSEARTLPTNNSLNNSVACGAGETLLMGGCVVARTDPQSDKITLFQHGFDDTNANAWRCGWNNPTDTTPTATATAICLRPPIL